MVFCFHAVQPGFAKESQATVTDALPLSHASLCSVGLQWLFHGFLALVLDDATGQAGCCLLLESIPRSEGMSLPGGWNRKHF